MHVDVDMRMSLQKIPTDGGIYFYTSLTERVTENPDIVVSGLKYRTVNWSQPVKHRE